MNKQTTFHKLSLVDRKQATNPLNNSTTSTSIRKCSKACAHLTKNTWTIVVANPKYLMTSHSSLFSKLPPKTLIWSHLKANQLENFMLKMNKWTSSLTSISIKTKFIVETSTFKISLANSFRPASLESLKSRVSKVLAKTQSLRQPPAIWSRGTSFKTAFSWLTVTPELNVSNKLLSTLTKMSSQRRSWLRN